MPLFHYSIETLEGEDAYIDQTLVFAENIDQVEKHVRENVLPIYFDSSPDDIDTKMDELGRAWDRAGERCAKFGGVSQHYYAPVLDLTTGKYYEVETVKWKEAEL